MAVPYTYLLFKILPIVCTFKQQLCVSLTSLIHVFVAARKTSAVVAQRHDMSKMRLYKHFKFTIIFAVIGKYTHNTHVCSVTYVFRYL